MYEENWKSKSNYIYRSVLQVVLLLEILGLHGGRIWLINIILFFFYFKRKDNSFLFFKRTDKSNFDFQLFSYIRVNSWMLSCEIGF